MDVAGVFTKFFIVTNFLSVSIQSTIDNVPFVEKYYDQDLNHFSYYNDPDKPSTFKQRYLYQDKWWDKAQGPIFFYTGNEGNVVELWNGTGLVFELAEKFRAFVIFAEHRFYGKSLPFGPDQSYVHPNIDLLTADQALADYAVLIDWLRTTVIKDPNRIVIAFGGSYGGMLSAYIRFKYPNIVTGSLAASAPIYLSAGLAPRNTFFQDVTTVFHDAVPKCENKVREAFVQMKKLQSQGVAGLEEISQAFSLCKPLTGPKDVDHLVGWIRNAFAQMAMFNYPYPISQPISLPAHPVKAACQKILQQKGVLSGLAMATDLIYGQKNCSDIWKEYVSCSDPTGCGLGPLGKSWSYQACTDFIMPAGTDNKTDMFPDLPFTLEQRADYCRGRWGVTPSNQWPKITFFGRDIKSASNIVFSNGKLDPWHRGGVLKSVSDSLVAIVIDESAHHLDLRGSNPADPPSVVKARLTEADYIHKWIQSAQDQKEL